MAARVLSTAMRAAARESRAQLSSCVRPPGSLLLRSRPALRRRAAGTGLLPAPARGARRVRDSGCPLLRHPLVLERFVLLLVLDTRSLIRHEALLPILTGPKPR